MEAVRIIIAMNNDASIIKIKQTLWEYGYSVIDEVRDGNECLRKIRVLKPDIVVLEYGLPSVNGSEIARIAVEDKLCNVILIATTEQESLIGDIKSESGFVYMTKPLNKQALINIIDLMVKFKQRIEELEKEIVQLKETLDTRKEIERAKGILMKQMGLSETEAYKKIQKQSMDRGIAMKEIARAIILAYEI